MALRLQWPPSEVDALTDYMVWEWYDAADTLEELDRADRDGATNG